MTGIEPAFSAWEASVWCTATELRPGEMLGSDRSRRAPCSNRATTPNRDGLGPDDDDLVGVDHTPGCRQEVFEIGSFHAASMRGTDRNALRRSASVSTPANGVIWRRSIPCWVRASMAVTMVSVGRSRRALHSSSSRVSLLRLRSRERDGQDRDTLPDLPCVVAMGPSAGDGCESSFRSCMLMSAECRRGRTRSTPRR